MDSLLHTRSNGRRGCPLGYNYLFPGADPEAPPPWIVQANSFRYLGSQAYHLHYHFLHEPRRPHTTRGHRH